ncbi:MAG: helix-turn-helix transcriptional regulator [Bacteroides sp.]|nr:helix-turn-helix transcriptional regulator [Bacteroides sp.]
MKLRIKELMEEKGVTSVSMATSIGIHKVSFSNIINGKINPSAETLEKIAEALGVEMWELFASKEEIVNQDKNTITCPKCGAKFELKED